MNDYILEYYQRITDGTIIAGEKIKRWYELVLKNLKDKVYFFDKKKANRAIRFIETFCHHHEGDLAPQLVKLELWQKAFLSVIFGCVDEDGNRHFREIVLIVGRKNGKTLLGACLSAYMAFMDGEYGARVYYIAPKLLQANLCFEAFCQMVEKESELAALARKRRTDVYIEQTNTSIQPIAFNQRKSDGLNPSMVIADELSSWVGDAGLKQYEVIKSALGARKQPMILSISTAGYVNEGIYDELVKRSTAVLNGDSRESRLAPFIYDVDDITKWNDINELQKANPNLNVSVSVNYLLEEIAVAEGSLSKRSEFIVKYCNRKQNSSLSWLNAEDVEKAYGEHFDLEDFRDCYCVGGIDLSRSTDLTASCIVIQKNGELFVIAKFFLPAAKLDEAIARDGLPYRIYLERGILQLSGENFIDYNDCFNWYRSMVEDYNILPQKIGYDRYNATYLTEQMKQYGFNMDDVFQGNNLTSTIHQFEGELKDGKVHIGDNDLLKAHLLDTALKIDAEREKCQIVKLYKNAHIDGTACLLDAWVMRLKWWQEVGGRLTNEG